MQGFEADWRDAFPGINAVTLMELANPPDPRRLELLPVVTYAVTRRLAKGTPDYWDHATLLELGVLAKDEAAASEATANALAAVRENWEPETTARNLGLIREAGGQRRGRGLNDDIEQALLARGSVGGVRGHGCGDPPQSRGVCASAASICCEARCSAGR